MRANAQTARSSGPRMQTVRPMAAGEAKRCPVSQSEPSGNRDSIRLPALGHTWERLLPYETYALVVDAMGIIVIAVLISARPRPMAVRINAKRAGMGGPSIDVVTSVSGNPMQANRGRRVPSQGEWTAARSGWVSLQCRASFPTAPQLAAPVFKSRT